MATLYITEYKRTGNESTDSANEPAVAEQTVAIGGATAASAAFNSGTSLVRLHTDAICSVKFGTSPIATAASARMAANETRWFGVRPGAGLKVAVITNS